MPLIGHYQNVINDNRLIHDIIELYPIMTSYYQNIGNLEVNCYYSTYDYCLFLSFILCGCVSKSWPKTKKRYSCLLLHSCCSSETKTTVVL